MERRYQGLDKRWWTVDEVHPAPGARLRDRRMAAGWLRFRDDAGKQVCVAPIPPRWMRFDEEDLEAFRSAGLHAAYTDARSDG